MCILRHSVEISFTLCNFALHIDPTLQLLCQVEFSRTRRLMKSEKGERRTENGKINPFSHHNNARKHGIQRLFHSLTLSRCSLRQQRPENSNIKEVQIWIWHRNANIIMVWLESVLFGTSLGGCIRHSLAYRSLCVCLCVFFFHKLTHSAEHEFYVADVREIKRERTRNGVKMAMHYCY